MKKTTILILFFLLHFCSSKSQSTGINTSLDSLLMKSWKLINYTLNGNIVPITDVQKDSKLILHSNHISENISNGNIETGKWSLLNKVLRIKCDTHLNDETLFKIQTITKSKLELIIIDKTQKQSLMLTLTPSD